MNKIKCLLCGKKFVKPLAHAWQKHGVSAREYKIAFGLDVKKGIITEGHRELLAERVRENYDKVVTENLLKNGKTTRYKKGDTSLGRYERSAETQARLKTHFERVANRQGRTLKIKKIIINCASCGKPKEIYPRYYKEKNNFCGVVCRNRANNKNKWKNEK